MEPSPPPADEVMIDFIRAATVREGAWVIEPRPAAFKFIEGLRNDLRRIPSTVHHPDGYPIHRFAERGARGKWLFVWIPT